VEKKGQEFYQFSSLSREFPELEGKGHKLSWKLFSSSPGSSWLGSGLLSLARAHH
jgi:hypothetical protein